MSKTKQKTLHQWVYCTLVHIHIAQSNTVHIILNRPYRILVVVDVNPIVGRARGAVRVRVMIVRGGAAPLSHRGRRLTTSHMEGGQPHEADGQQPHCVRSFGGTAVAAKSGYLVDALHVDR